MLVLQYFDGTHNSFLSFFHAQREYIFPCDDWTIFPPSKMTNENFRCLSFCLFVLFCLSSFFSSFNSLSYLITFESCICIDTQIPFTHIAHNIARRAQTIWQTCRKLAQRKRKHISVIKGIMRCIWFCLATAERLFVSSLALLNTVTPEKLRHLNMNKYNAST